MKKTILTTIFLIHGFILCICQSTEVKPFYEIEKPSSSGEQITLETDRDFYCVSEKIFFTAGYHFDYHIEGVNWSNVLYVELIRWNGDKIAQAKYKLSESGASGYLSIPENVLSGNYYMRAYTKWMRNFPVEKYAYRIIKVLNPFINTIEGGTSEENKNPQNTGKPSTSKNLSYIACTTDKNTYKPREKIDLTLVLNNSELVNHDFCLSVAKIGSIDTNNHCLQLPVKQPSDKGTLSHLPETRGISITGKIIDKHTQNPISNKIVDLSTPQNYLYFSTYYSVSNGLFSFTLPDFYGSYDFNIEAKIDSGETADILIDNDFCNKEIKLPYTPFSLNENEEEVAREMIVNMQLNKIYSDTLKTENISNANLPFFGNPIKVYYTEEYIKLPNLEEFFFEIVKEVRVAKKKKQTYLKIYDRNGFMNLPPLVLIDNIPVPQGSDFLKTPLNKIEKVEVVDKPYYASNKRYNGIICIFTKNKDFAGIKLSDNSMFFNYNLFSDGNFYAPDYKTNTNQRISDRRNVLLWDPNIKFAPGKATTLSLFTSDSKGEYLVYVRDAGLNGKSRIYGTCRIVVE